MTGTALAGYAVTSEVCSLAATAIDTRISTIEHAALTEIDRRARWATAS